MATAEIKVRAMNRKEAAVLVCGAMDWSGEALADARALAEAGQPREALVAWLEQWQANTQHTRPWTREYVIELRMAAGEAGRSAATETLETYLGSELPLSAHAPFLGLPDEVLFLAVQDADMFTRIADKVLSVAGRWAQISWGTTDSLCRALLRLLVLPECRVDELIPVLAWLVTANRGEWKWSRTWGEDMLGTSGHNWWLHTFRGFYLGGLHFPELDGLGRFRDFAPEYFERELDLLMEVDGFTRERSGYHWGTVDHWMSILHHTSCDTVALAPWCHDKIRAVASTAWKAALPHGGVSLWGDGGADYLPVLRDRMPQLAAALQIPELKYVAQQLFPDWQPPYPEFLPGWGRNLWLDWERLEARAPDSETADTTLPVTKYFVMRTDWSAKADAITFIAGPQGTTVTSHDHTHVGTFEMFVSGKPVLIDNGSGPYGKDPARLWRVSSAAHNVATVDGEDHIPMTGEWRWAQPVNPTLDAWRSEPTYAYCSVAHEGYNRLPDPVPGTRRKLFWVRGGYAILIDRFQTAGEAAHAYDIHFHVKGACEGIENGRVVAGDEGGRLLIVPVPGLCGSRSVEACPYPLKTYANPSHVCYRDTRAGNSIYVTLLVPFAGERPLIEVESLNVHCDNRVLAPHEATALAITIDGHRDVYFDQHMHWNLRWEAGGCSGTQRLFHSCMATDSR